MRARSRVGMTLVQGLMGLSLFALLVGSEAEAKGGKVSLSLVGGLQLPYQLLYKTKNDQVQTGLNYWTGAGAGTSAGFSLQLFDVVLVDAIFQSFSYSYDDPNSSDPDDPSLEASQTSVMIPIMYRKVTPYGCFGAGFFYSGPLDSTSDPNFGVSLVYRAESDKHRFIAQTRGTLGFNIDSNGRTLNSFHAELGFKLY